MALTLQGTSVCYLNSDMGSNFYILPMSMTTIRY